MHDNLKWILNFSLRSATLGTRFLFIFFLAKYLDPSSVGYYGLFSAAIGYALYFIGLDFYTYVTREIIKTPKDQRGKILKNQAALSAVMFVFVFPFAIVFLFQSNWPGRMLWWFFPLLFLEYCNQELSRLMAALSEQLTASIILFVRQGSWAVSSALLLNFHAPSRNLDVILSLWGAAGVAAAIMGFWKLNKLKMGGWYQPVDWIWIRKGVVISSAFLLATLAIRAVNTFDRYWLEALGNINIVAAYVLLLGIAGTLMTFLDAGVLAYAYPALIHHHHNQESLQARVRVRLVVFQTAAFSMAFAVTSWFALPYLLHWIGNPIYIEFSYLYPWLLLATIINALSMAPHYGLYAQGHDKPIIYSHAASLGAFIIATWAFSADFGVMAVPLGLNIAFGVMLIWKTIAYWQACK